MTRFEYSVVPAPTKGVKAKGTKTPEARFALSIETLMNDKAAEGWEYVRAETLPSLERQGLTGSTTNWRHVLVFRRLLNDEDDLSGEAEAARQEPPVAADPEHVEVQDEHFDEPIDDQDERSAEDSESHEDQDDHPDGRRPGAGSDV